MIFWIKSGLLAIFYLFYCIYLWQFMLHMFQQNRYELYRLYKWYLGNLKQRIIPILVNIIAIYIVYYTTHNLGNYYAELITVGLYLVIYLELVYFNSKKVSIKPLVYTSRVKRQIVVLFLLNAIIFYFVNKELETYWVYLMAVAWPLQWLLLVVMDIITLPIENGVKGYYKNLAKKKLMQSNALRIGITGSFGKTSSKMILQDVLSSQFISLCTPGSFNTPMGITKTIRYDLKPIHEIFICEMGADHKGDIKELMNFVQPKYGLVTSIGEQHLNTFKSLDNIIHEKMLEIEMLPSDGVGFINLDNEYIRNYTIKNTCKKVTFAIHQPADYQAIDIVYSNNGSEFKVLNNNDVFLFKTKLLGENNVSNILAAIAIARELNVSWAYIQQAVLQVSAIEHRLQKRFINGYTFIDNAFNSNPVGAKTSLDVLAAMSGKRVLVTPGFIDLGAKQDFYNHQFGTQMKDHVDTVILVGKNQTTQIYKGLQESGFDMEQVIVVDHVTEAFEYVYSHFSINDTILLENDLPDAFNN